MLMYCPITLLSEHAELVKDICNVRYKIGQSGSAGPGTVELADVRASLQSSLGAHHRLVELVNAALVE